MLPQSQNPPLNSGGTYMEGMIALLFTCSLLLGLCICKTQRENCPLSAVGMLLCGA